MGITASSGFPYPLGASVTANGVNFAVTCYHAEAVYVCLFHQDTEELLARHLLPAKTGDVWHGEIAGVPVGQLYGYEVARKKDDKNARRLLIDPYAKRLSRPQQYIARQYSENSQFMIAKSVVVDNNADNISQRPEKVAVRASKRIIYEAHVKGLSQRHPDVPEQERGTYLGASHPAVINHIKQLGVTCVQFMPLFAFMPEPYITAKGLTNYWGYNPFTFFAPEPRYAVSNALQECRQMVDAYHAAGIEVILDVVFNHTAEGGEDGPNLSFRGLLTDEVYLKIKDKTGKQHYANYSGCGNTVDTSHPFMFNYILDAMRFWLTEMRVDGFRFDLAPCVGREPHSFNRHSGLIKAMLQDPTIKQAVLIAEPWDMGPDGYQLGAFPYPWFEVNDKFRDTVRAFWRGDAGLIGDFATRIMGSRDCFHKHSRPVVSSINNITYHDGFTLHDLVTYNEKHNLANGEENRDGHSHNLSWNCGVEGETQDSKIIALREKQKRNLFATLLLSQGTPHMVAGDEMGRTQLGNNNAYCQDNDMSWLQWELDKTKQDFMDFCKTVIALRQSSQLLGNLHLEDDTFTDYTNADFVNWYKPDGTDKASEDWQIKHNRAFALELRCADAYKEENEHWLICVNASDNDVRFHLPTLPQGGGWHLRLDTRYSTIAEQPHVCMQQVFLQQGKSLVLFSYQQPLTKLP
ncbi:glycogen debranching enzyme GlgX [Alteromonas sediminis]|uniref:Glycogen debranching enzyme GlgX n=1 Tax=Alteromonas sediminis TaxID=2259342 RepID=A0A3N5Y652_9ALTE|nr:glycogen debranching protein GlgX [Alteromonas sediminis]RPJ68756.1 glycogen debranching enzyme GlgX [Alteromonas sediminis]